MSGQPAVLQVVILRDGLLLGTEVLVPGAYSLGSAQAADVVLEDPTVDAKHAVLYFQNGRAAVQDQTSKGGTWVNGHRVNTCEVRSVDELALGPFTLKMRVLAQKSKDGPPADVAALLQRGGKSPATGPTGRGGQSQTQTQTRTNTSENTRSPPPIAPVVQGTMLSARRMGAAAAKQETLPSRAPHLREVTPLPYIEDPPTEAVMLPATVRAEIGNQDPPTAIQRTPPPRKVKGHAKASRLGRLPPPRRAPPDADPKLKGESKLFLDIYWGDQQRDSRSFGDLKKPAIAAHDELAMVPLYGFTLGGGDFVLAEQAGKAYRLFVPKQATVERLQPDGRFFPVRADKLDTNRGRRFISLTQGQAVRLTEGQMSLLAYVQVAQKRPFAFPKLPWLLITLMTIFIGGLGAFLKLAPEPRDTADFEAKNLNPVAVKLIAPEPKKKEEAKKKVEALKEKAKSKAETTVVEKGKPTKKEKVELPPAAVAESKALKALSKLAAAGPASGDILAAVDKLGNGPGSKTAKGFKLSGMIGQGPIANAGLGTFGLGGGGGGGFGAKGAEVLRGRGGGGIGALGVGNVGRGSVGGTVTRATGSRIGIAGNQQGTIDREAVAKVVNSHLQQVRACYERALLKEPGLAGKVVLEWTISTDGKVVTAKTKTSTLQNSAVEGCILTQLKGWAFPKAKGGIVIVSYPFLFNSVGY